MCTYFRLNITVGFLEGPMNPNFWALPLAVYKLQEEESVSQTLKPKRRLQLCDWRDTGLLCFPGDMASAGGGAVLGGGSINLVRSFLKLMHAATCFLCDFL